MVTTEAPSDDGLCTNALDLEQELAWFANVLDARLSLHFGQEEVDFTDVTDIEPPELSDATSPFGRFVAEHSLTFAERLALVLVLAPHLRPRLLDVFFIKNETFDRRFTEFGGLRRGADGDFEPTGETLAFLLGGTDLEARFATQRLLDPDHLFARLGVLGPDPDEGHGYQPAMKAALRPSAESLSRFTTGRPLRPAQSARFPAQYIETALTWDDLVLHPGTRKQIDEIHTWIEHGPTLMDEWGMAPKLRPGFRSLFHGPPGTGKTMTACLLGKSDGRDVYKIDLSLVVSKYIGETEKNLARVFDQAQHRDWILFFDEAESLFGKRTETRDAHDRYANQEISFLLQRIETFDGIAILASNFRQNLDEAFSRRFESVIYFPLPRPKERLRLWQQGFSPQASLDPELDLERVAREHELSGGSIMNVIRYTSLCALRDNGRAITEDDVLAGVRRELAKEGKVA